MNITFFKGRSEKKEDPITKTALKILLHQKLTPLLKDIGLTKYNGEYLWFSDFNSEGIKLVFKYILMKGERGLFSWGVCFDYVPTFSQTKQIKHHKTDKSTTLHLWEWPRGYSNSFMGGGRPTELISHWGEKDCIRTLDTIFELYKSEIIQWYAKASTTIGCLELVNDQLKNGGAYNIHYPHPKHVLIFLTAKLGDKAKAFELLKDHKEAYLKHDMSWEPLFRKVEKQLETI